MPTIFTHPVVPLAIGAALGRRIIPPRLLACGAIAAILPDLDVIAFRLGIPYAAEFGHRGFSHSLLFAFSVALLGACCFRWLRASFLRSFLFLLSAISSHGLLDTLTNGGLGIALLWPWSEHRHFAPLQPIEVAPLGVSRFFSERGVSVLKSEFLWVWLPAIAVGMALFAVRVARPRGSEWVWWGEPRQSGNFRSGHRTAAHIALCVAGLLGLIAGIGYVFRAHLPPRLQAIIVRHIDRPASYPSYLVVDRPKRVTDKASLEHWLTAAAMCDPMAIMDVQSPQFLADVRRLGVRIEASDEGPPDGTWKLPKGVKVFSYPVESFDYWADSGADVSLTLIGETPRVVKLLGARPAFFLASETSPVVFSGPVDLYVDGVLDIRSYTYVRGIESNRTMVGCTSIDG